MQKRQNLDLDDLLGNSPPWPLPLSSHYQNKGDDDREVGSGQWVDKLMVNKQDQIEIENSLACWDSNSGHVSDVFPRNLVLDSSKFYPEKPYGLFPGNNQFEVSTTDDLDELDAGTSDSSEPDLLWQFNHSKFSNMIGQNAEKPQTKQTKSPELR